MTNRKLEAGSWVTVLDHFRPAKIVYSENSRTHYVILESLVANAGGKREIVKMRSPSFEGLRQEIVRRFPQATFSVTNESATRTENGIALDSRTLQAKSEWNADRTAYLESAAVDQVNRQRLEDMPQEERDALRTNTVLEWMATEPLIVANPTFFTWPTTDKNYNYRQLLNYFDALGWILPDAEQVGRAFRYLLDNRLFYTKETLQRSEEHLRPSRKFGPDMLQSPRTITPAQLVEAKRKLQIFAGRRITREMALQVCNSQEVDAVMNEMDAAKLRTTQDLQAEVVGSWRVRTRSDLASDSKYF